MTIRNIPLTIVDAVRNRYAAPNRFYHGLNHLDHLLSVQSKTFAQYKHSDIISNEYGDSITVGYAADLTVLAILFHDIVYNVWEGSPVNEADSAHYLENIYGDQLIHEGKWSRLELKFVSKMIRITANHDKDNSNVSFLEKLMLDIDISNFAESLDVCKYNQHQIFLEFEPRFPNKEQFLAGNIEFLQKLLNRPKIYYTPMFADKENKARENILAMIKGDN